MSRRKGILFLLLTMGAIAMIVPSTGTLLAAPEDIEPPSTAGLGGGKVFDAENYLIAGGQAVISLDPSTKEVAIARGSSLVIPVTLNYLPGTDAPADVRVEALGIKGSVIPPSIAAQSTPEARSEAFATTGKIPGAIELAQFTSFSPESVTLNPLESATIEMTISIPDDFPDDIGGFFANPDFRSPDEKGPLTVYVESSGVWVSLE